MTPDADPWRLDGRVAERDRPHPQRRRGVGRVVTRREVIARIASGEYTNISFIHEIADRSVEDVTEQILAEAALPEVATNDLDRDADSFDHARDLRKHETV